MRRWYLALLVRLCLICYAEWQDNNFVVRYTDVDYRVFTDGARFVTAGESPFMRATYRYTPLLAWLLTPNVLLHPVWGKLLFALCDLIAGYLIEETSVHRGVKRAEAVWWSAAAWLFNPLIVNVSTRGNAEALIGVLVLGAIFLLLRGQHRLSALLYGVAVHVKIYPLVYAIGFFLFLGHPKKWWTLRRAQVEFTAISASMFIILTAAMYHMYGYTFLYEAYLYHVVRKDNRHNFSVYFYSLYLSYSDPSSAVSSIAAFVPQIVLLVTSSFVYRTDPAFFAFVQTFLFVAFNKVCTVQYFVWYLSLLPFALQSVSWKPAPLCALLGLWFAGQGAWLGLAYLLEFEGRNTFVEVWAAGILFFVVNVAIVVFFIANYQPTHCRGR